LHDPPEILFAVAVDELLDEAPLQPQHPEQTEIQLPVVELEEFAQKALKWLEGGVAGGWRHVGACRVGILDESARILRRFDVHSPFDRALTIWEAWAVDSHKVFC